MKDDNRGFTLTELIICIAIFSIVALAAFGFMVSGARSYASVSDRVGRQLRAQMTFSQIENRLVDCNYALTFADNRLCIVNKNEQDAAKFDVYVYKLDTTDHTLYFGKHEEQAIQLDKDKKLTAASVAAFDATEVLTKRVAGFDVAIKDRASDNAYVRSVNVKLILQTASGADGVSDTQVAALRNAPLWLG